MAYYQQPHYAPTYYQSQPQPQLQQRRSSQNRHQPSQPTSAPTPEAHYICLYPACHGQHKRLADLERHISIVHYREFHPLYDCEFEGGACGRKGARGFTRKDKMVEHMRDVHKCNIPKRTIANRTPS